MKLREIFILFILLFSLSSCEKNRGGNKDKIAKKSVLFYMANNNNLYSTSVSNLEELIASYDNNLMKDANLIVYFRGRGNVDAQLLSINNNKEAKVIKTYENHNAADSETLRSVVADFKKLFPSENYGCVFWSHASGWLPKGFLGTAESYRSFSYDQNRENEPDITTHPLYPYIRQVEGEGGVTTRSFGQDGSDWMEIEDLSDALGDNEFDFIIFDACYMASIEVAYELRNKANWLLAAPSEVLGDGFDYTTYATHFFSDLSTKDLLIEIADDYTEKYSETTVSLIDLTKIDDFAAKYKTMMAKIDDKVGKCTPSNVQRYDRYSDHVLFDLVDYISKLDNGKYSEEIETMVDDIVAYKYATDSFLFINMSNVHGISSYIPFDYYNLITPTYQESRWYNDILAIN